jgi:4-amino-4-deoxy-L-arabinose transferase-like glycosyltransferase
MLELGFGLARDTPLNITSQTESAAGVTPAQRIGWALLIAATLYICYFSNLNVIGFVGPDEPRYAWIARDMAETGDWVTPRLYNRPWFEKPPLLYWGGAVFFKLLGAGHPEVAGRLPSAICALIATLALAWLAWRTYGERCARWLLLLLPTSVGMIGFSHAAATDMPFAGMLTMAMVCAAVVLGLTSSENTPILPYTPWAALLLFGFFLGLAVLAKGPAAVILSGGTVFFWAVFTKRWRAALRLLHPAAIASFCVTALPWYILCARRNPDFFRVFIIEHNFKRYLTPEFQHIQPFWYYLPILLIAFLPWVTTLFWSLWIGVRTRGYHPLTSLLLSWSAFCVLFFSISRSKLPGYILPAVPAIGLLLSRAVQVLGPAHIKSCRRFAMGGSLFFAAISVTLYAISHAATGQPHLNSKAGTSFALLAVSFSLANFLLTLALEHGERRSAVALLVCPAVPIFLAVFFASWFAWSVFENDPSGKTMAVEIRRPFAEATDVFVGPISRGKRYGLTFYLNREVKDWDPTHPRVGTLVLEKKNCREVVPAPYACGDADWLGRAGAFVYSITVNDSFGLPGSGGQPK